METKQRFREQNFPFAVWRNKQVLARDFFNVILEDYYSLHAKSEAGLVFSAKLLNLLPSAAKMTGAQHECLCSEHPESTFYKSIIEDFDNFVKFKPEEYDHIKRLNFLEVSICSQTPSML